MLYIHVIPSGYPKPNVTVVKTTKTGNLTEEENLTQDIRDLIFESFFDNFAAEVNNIM